MTAGGDKRSRIQRHSHRRNGHHNSYRGKRSGRGKKAGTRNLAGKLILLAQLLLSVILLAVVWNSGMVPGKYPAVLFVVLILLFGALFALQFLKSKVYILGIVLSIIIDIVLVFGIYYMLEANQMLADVGGATYKTDNMIVVVRADDDAENIIDAKNYTFGT